MVKGKRAEKNGAAPTPPVPPPNNKPVELTAEELFALQSQWKRQVLAGREALSEARKAVNTATGNLRAQYKKCKAELGEDGLRRVQLLADIDGDEGAIDRLRQDLADMMYVAQWADAFEGKQLELMPDLRPTADRAYDDGKKAGIAGDAFNCRYGQGTEAYHRFQDGWQAGQEICARGIKPLETPPAPLGAPETQPEAKVETPAQQEPAAS